MIRTKDFKKKKLVLLTVVSTEKPTTFLVATLKWMASFANPEQWARQWR